MASISKQFTILVILTIVYFKGFIIEAIKCRWCSYDTMVTNLRFANYTIDPLACYGQTKEQHQIEERNWAKTCTWDIVRETFKRKHFQTTKPGKPSLKKMVPVYTGMMISLDYSTADTPNICESIEIRHVNIDEKIKVIRCYCGTPICNDNWPLCKWLRGADPSLKDPTGCVEDDIFPSNKEPRLSTLDSKSTQTQTDSRTTTSQTENSSSPTCDDDNNEIYKGLKEIQDLLNEI